MIELGLLSDRDADEDSDAISRADSRHGHRSFKLSDELNNFAEGQAKRIALRVDKGSNVEFLYDVDKHHRDVTVRPSCTKRYGKWEMKWV